MPMLLSRLMGAGVSPFLKKRNAELEAALQQAQARIAELEKPATEAMNNKGDIPPTACTGDIP